MQSIFYCKHFNRSLNRRPARRLSMPKSPQLVCSSPEPGSRCSSECRNWLLANLLILCMVLRELLSWCLGDLWFRTSMAFVLNLGSFSHLPPPHTHECACSWSFKGLLQRWASGLCHLYALCLPSAIFLFSCCLFSESFCLCDLDQVISFPCALVCPEVKWR